MAVIVVAGLVVVATVAVLGIAIIFSFGLRNEFLAVVGSQVHVQVWLALL